MSELEKYKNQIKSKKNPIGPAKAWFQGLESDVQKKMVIVGIVIVFLVLCWAMYPSGRGDATAKMIANKQNKITEISLDEKMIENHLYRKADAVVDKTNKELLDLKAEIAQIKANPQTVIKQVVEPPKAKGTEPGNGAQAEIKSSKPLSTDGLPPQPSAKDKTEELKNRLFAPPPAPPVQTVAPRINMVGGISITTNKQAKEAETDNKDEDKKKVETIYLPPSFVAATTLSGMAAPTTEAGKTNPLPVFIRIKDLAVLPNKVKADLKGCFILGSAYGQLADERLHVRINTLSCVAKNGTAVIDQGIKGFVVDADGRVGMKGKVVSRMSALLVRSGVAGLLEGIGEGVSLSTQVTSFDSAGNSQAIFEENTLQQIATSGLGKGLSNAAGDLQKYFMELARQSGPVIESGSGRQITVVFSEGVELEIKEKNLGHRS